jgi:hypothetical protein
MQVRFDASQDRLAFRVNTQDGSQFRFWLTRRLLKRWARPLMETLHKAETTQTGLESQQAMASFRQDSVRERGDFSTPFEEQAADLPLGDDGMLVTEIRIQEQANATYNISMADQQGRSATFNFPPDMLHSLFALLSQTISEADWGFELTLGEHPNGTIH